MKKKLRILSLLLACAMVLSLAACSTDVGSGASSSTPAPAAQTPPPADAPEDGADEPAPAAEVEPYQFNISYGGTPSSSMVAVMELLQKELSDASGGAFTFNVYNDNSYKESQALDEMMNDVVDIVYLGSAAASTTVTEVAYLGLPGCFRFTDDPDAFLDYEASLSDIMSEIYDGYGIHYLGLRVPAKMAIVGNGEVPTSPEGLQGKIVRVSGTWLGKFAVSMGIATSNIGLSELATALQRKTIDSCFTGIEQVYSQMLGEVVEYACVLPETDGVGALVMDADTWGKLSDAQKACVEQAVDNWMRDCLAVSDQFYQESIDALEEHSVNIYYYDDAECDAFLATVGQVYDEIDAGTTDLGNSLREAMQAWRAENLA